MGLYRYYKHFQDRYWRVVYCPTHFFQQYAVVSCVSFEGQDTPSLLRVGWRTAKSTTSGTSLRGALQVENRFPSVKIFITVHQPRSFLSPQLWTRTNASPLLLDETFFSCTMLTPVYRIMYIYTWASIDTTSIFKRYWRVVHCPTHFF